MQVAQEEEHWLHYPEFKKYPSEQLVHIRELLVELNVKAVEHPMIYNIITINQTIAFIIL